MPPITAQNYDPFGAVLPMVATYQSYAGQPLFTEFATIYAPAREQTRDYAKELLDRIRKLKNIYVTSFGPGSVPPSAQAFRDAETFILNLPLHRTGLPTINVASDGEVNFDWSSESCRIDLGFFGNGTYSFYGRSGNREISGDDIAVGHDISQEFIEIAAASP